MVTLKEWTLDQVRAACATFKEVALLTTVNYEVRSVASLFLWQKLTYEQMRTHVAIIRLQSQTNRVEALEGLKSTNYEIAHNFIIKEWKGAPARIEVGYPADFSPGDLQSELRTFLDQCRESKALLVDITAIPTRMLLPVLDFIEASKADHPNKRIFLLYTWARTYPKATSITQVGSVKLVMQNMLLQKLVQLDKEVRPGRCIVVMGRQGFDTHQVLDAVPAGMKKHLLHMTQKNDMDHSFHVLAANRPALTDPAVTLEYFSTMQRGATLLEELTATARGDPKQLTLIANFGPKPLSAAAYFTVKGLLRQVAPQRDNGVVVADLLSLSSHHYGSVYSIGTGPTSAYEI